MNQNRVSRLSNPWWIVFAAFLGLSVSAMTILNFAISILIKPISEEFEWGRSTVSSAVSVATMVLAISAPIIGRLIDIWGSRLVTLVAICLSSIATALMSFAPGDATAFLLLSAALGLCLAGQTPPAYAKVITTAFDRNRGLALGIGMAGLGVGTALAPRFTQALLEIYGWRGAFVGLGLMIFVVAFPAVAIFLREPTAQPSTFSSIHNLTDTKLPAGLTTSEVLRRLDFWILVTVFVIVPMVCNGTIVHLYSLLTDRSLSAGVAAKVFSGIGASVFISRLLCGALLDRYFAPYVAMFFLALPALGALLLCMNLSTYLDIAGAMLVGVGLGAEIDLIAYLQSRYFGMRAFGQVYGYLFMAFAVGAGLGPLGMGLSFDRAGSYQPMLIGFVALMALAIYLLNRLPKLYPYPVSTGSA